MNNRIESHHRRRVSEQGGNHKVMKSIDRDMSFSISASPRVEAALSKLTIDLFVTGRNPPRSLVPICWDVLRLGI